MSNVQRWIDATASYTAERGFEQIGGGAGTYEAFFVRRTRLTSYAFLVLQVSEGSRDSGAIRGLIGSARGWCQTALQSKLVTGETGLNLVLLYQGEFDPEVLKKKVDAASVRAVILQSLTAVNTETDRVDQVHTLVLGRVKKVLRALREPGSPGAEVTHSPDRRWLLYVFVALLGVALLVMRRLL